MSPLTEPPLSHELVARREELRRAGKRLVMTNGCFDLLHAGHLWFLRESSKLGEELWVGINGDTSVRALKGELRPVQSEAERAFALTSLRWVDAVFVFHTPRLVAEIEQLRPDLYTKAGDYTLETLDVGERTALQAGGAEIRFIPFLEGFSTTSLIGKIGRAAGSFGAG